MAKAKPKNEEIINFESTNQPALDLVDEVEKVNKSIEEDIRENEIDEGLAEIYQDENGNMSDVKKIDTKKTHGIIYKMFVSVILLVIIFVGGKKGYDFYLQKTANTSAIVFTLEADREIVAGKEFYYTIAYKNFDKVALKNITITAIFPDNFIYLESSMPTSTSNNTWKIDFLDVKRSGEIKIKGKLVGAEEQKNILLASMSYTPANFSSEFRKDASFENKISSIGIDFTFNTSESVLIGEETELLIKYKAKPDNSINSFRITAEPTDNIEFLNNKTSSSTKQASSTIAKISASSTVATSTLPGVWQVDQVGEKEAEVIIKFKFKDKLEEGNKLVLKFEFSPDGQKYLPFLNKEVSFEVMKRNLNLNLIINGSRIDQGIDFGQTLNYSVAYSNKGDTKMNDVVVMAVLESDFLDWESLDDKNMGKVKNGTIIWTKAEIPSLATITPNTSGSIDFSIKVGPIGQIDPNKKYQVDSYARFSVGNAPADQNRENNRSNEIVSKINSDLSVKEQIKYFNDDNIAVGSGPLPPKVGMTTSYKVYWDLSNNLNELTNLRVETVLPPNVSWDSKNQTDLGTIQYDTNSRKVVWDIGRLPITVYKASAEFNISVTPTESDQNKIMILLPGAIIHANDSSTNSEINKTNKAKTTKLEDDQIITDDGRVQ